MNYALIEKGTVTNIIWLLERNTFNFPNAVFIGDKPIKVGDVYLDGKFYRTNSEGEIINEI